MANTFTAIDFETAQGKRWSICQIGLVRVEGGEVIQTYSKLIKPPYNFYWKRFTDIHGISQQMTLNAPTFDQIWNEVSPFITNQDVVAHNGFGFDFSCLSQTLEFYDLPVPNYNRHCTYRIYKDGLAALCRDHGIKLKHHDALSDALACAQLYSKFFLKKTCDAKIENI
jgi:DNA polymerase-3 subunit epsilon